jgi:hypothetical protein
MMRRLYQWLVRWISSYSEAEKLARVAQRHAIEQEIHATHD